MEMISIVMPSLNVAKYITECIESVVNQTYRNLEIILVDAGSTDGTLEIIEKFAQNDNRIVLIRSDRKSYGYQVNLGIQHAKGKYIGIIETDDIADNKMYEHLHKLIHKWDCDYVKGSSENFCDILSVGKVTDPIIVFNDDEYNEGIVDIEPCKHPELLLKDRFLWTGLYKSEFIRQVRLNETAGAAFQDIGFLTQTFIKAQRAVYSNRLVHHYRLDNSSASGFSTKCFKYLDQEYLYVDKLLENQDETWKEYAHAKLVYQLKGRFSQMAVAGTEWQSIYDDISPLVERIKKAISDNQISEKLENNNLFKFAIEFAANPQQLFENERSSYLRRVNNAKEVLNRTSEGETVIFGCGKIGNFVKKMLTANGISTICCFCDNNEKMWYEQNSGYEVLPPEIACEEYSHALYVIANMKHSSEIRQQLIDLGITEDSIIEYNAGISRSFYYLK